jgi:adenosylhomocysteine nucleosidase
MKIVVVISADAEWSVVKPMFADANFQISPFGERFETLLDSRPITLFHGGWGKISAAATTQYVIDNFSPELIINLGTCGGFAGRIELGTVVLVEKTIVYDISEQMTDGAEAIRFYTTDLDLSWLPHIVPSPVLRGLLVSGDRDIIGVDIPMLIEKYGAVAADWESGAIAWTANKSHVRTLILRGVSDLVDVSGSDTYGDYDLFIKRTGEIMRNLIEKLPKWVAAIEKVDQGYRGY